ncbi:hypothetical protein E2C01_002851 [Portunus trituberculatus]|uniref:Uncharacterized protein n=1 Tax=Portunus trituberculatus TaxID=210409 RepID=A0A5B7CL01_PORTR|nr:hypothetical protein [Portunus trituberculatus]
MTTCDLDLSPQDNVTPPREIVEQRGEEQQRQKQGKGENRCCAAVRRTRLHRCDLIGGCQRKRGRNGGSVAVQVEFGQRGNVSK